MKAFWLIVAATFAYSAHAAPGQLEASLLRCMSIAGQSERLACFESVTRGLGGELPGAPAVEPAAGVRIPVPVAAPPDPVAPAAVEAPAAATADFGQEHKPSERHLLESMTARVESVKRSGYGQLRVALDNGQVWGQVGTERYQLQVDDTVVIERASFNSFFLRKQGSTRKVRFTRLE